MTEYFWNWNDYTFYLKEENLKLRVLRLAAKNEVVQNSENVSPFLKRVCKELSEYFSGMRDCFDIPLILDGTEFQRKVWRELLNIPYGNVEMKRFLLDLESQHSGQKKFQNSELGFYLSRAYVSE